MGREYRKLIAWQKADELVMKVYQMTKTFPREEIYGLTGQLRRAALSVPTNIAEGMARKTVRDKSHFMVQAEASLSEVGFYWMFLAVFNISAKKTLRSFPCCMKKLQKSFMDWLVNWKIQNRKLKACSL